MTSKDTNPKDAIGVTKPPLSCIPMPVLYEVGNALLEGACKYGRHNWRTAGVRHSIYFDAAMRHLTSWWEGQDHDPESGIHHISKAIAGLMVVRDSMLCGNDVDDRPPASQEGFLDDIEVDTAYILARYPTPKEPHTEPGR